MKALNLQGEEIPLTPAQKRAVAYQIVGAEIIEEAGMDSLGNLTVCHTSETSPYDYYFSVTKRGKVYNMGSMRKWNR